MGCIVADRYGFYDRHGYVPPETPCWCMGCGWRGRMLDLVLPDDSWATCPRCVTVPVLTERSLKPSGLVTVFTAGAPIERHQIVGLDPKDGKAYPLRLGTEPLVVATRAIGKGETITVRIDPQTGYNRHVTAGSDDVADDCIRVDASRDSRRP